MPVHPTLDVDYDTALAQARDLYPGIRVGRPGRAHTYWPTVAALRALRLRWSVRLQGAHHVAPGPAILIGNHVSAMDPVVVVMTTWWRVTAFTKLEWFEHPAAIFFRLMGQIPLRRGDEPSTRWAMDMAHRTLADGGKIGLYPEGTRTPDPSKLHKLHRRVLMPVLEANPGVPVHAVTTTYTPLPLGRLRAEVNVSPALAIDHDTMSHQEITALIRDTLLELGGQTYVDSFARDVKGVSGKKPKA